MHAVKQADPGLDQSLVLFLAPWRGLALGPLPGLGQVKHKVSVMGGEIAPQRGFRQARSPSAQKCA
jgi:hypothetical protein